MGFFGLWDSQEPAPGSYQERLRALGRQIDQDRMRFRLLMEMPDGFLLKADELLVRPKGQAGSSWMSRTFWLHDPDIQAIVDDAHEDRDE